MLSEEIEAVKRFLAHERDVYTEVAAIRSAKELEETAFQTKKELSEETVKTIRDTIAQQQKIMDSIHSQLEESQLEHQMSLNQKLSPKKELSEETVKTIRDTIAQQQKIMDSIHSQLEESQLEHQMSLNQKLSLLSSAGQSLTGTIRDTIAQQQKIMDSIHSQLEESQLEHQMSLNQKLSLLSSAGQSLTGVTSAINALAEQYPVLYSYTSMDHFQRDIFDAEEHLQAARRLYNSNVSLYNQKIVSFPYLIVAKLHGMKKAAFYETDEKKKEFPGGLLWN